MNFLQLEQFTLVWITLGSMLLLWIMFYYWWRLNHNTAFYVKMLAEVILDLKYFILLYTMMIFTFTTTSLVLNSYFMTLNFYGDEHLYVELYDV